MKTLGIHKIMLWSLVALIVPLLGNQFVDGWNWDWHEFVFAWTFFVIMGTTIKLGMRQVSGTKYRAVVGVGLFLVFAGIWVMLATG